MSSATRAAGTRDRPAAAAAHRVPGDPMDGEPVRGLPLGGDPVVGQRLHGALLEEITLTGLGVLAAARLPLGPGLTVLTGETGAGKTMVLTALQLLLGGRADSSLVRAGDARAVVEGRVLLTPGHPVLARAEQAGAQPDEDGSLLLHRSIGAEGRSRATVGGAAVPAAVLGELGAALVAVHGQADQQRLGRPAEQRAVLDRFAGEVLTGPFSAYREAFSTRRALLAELAELTARATDRAVVADGLRHGLERVGALAPQPGEDRELGVVVARLTHADELARAAVGAHDALAGGGPGQAADGGGPAGDGGYLQVAAAARLLRAVAEHDPALADLADRLDAVGYSLADVIAELAGQAEATAPDPAALASAQERSAVLGALARRYAPESPDADGLLAWAAEAREQLRRLGEQDGRLAQVRDELAAVEPRLELASAGLSAVRAAAAAGLAAAVGAELVGLAMPSAGFGVSVSPLPPADRGPHGADEIVFTLGGHGGSGARPLARSASGGELSRVMLALEVVLAGADPVAAMVFDEVDAGVGGHAAVEVGRRLARLARHHQVLVVTHLPQVAAYADSHVRVARAADGRSEVVVLDDAGRVAELSRMLAGLAESSAAQAHAQELLELAAAERAA